jgi:sulfur-carrier protein
MIPSALRSYTQGSEAEASGSTLNEVLVDLDRQYPGIRFRMIDEQQQVRRHIRIFVNGVSANALSQTIQLGDELVIVQALSGG